MKANGHVVYISYDGMSEPLGQSQVLPYLEGLTKYGHTFELVSFEKDPTPPAFRGLAPSGIRSTRLRYHKTPRIPATMLDLAQGALMTGVLSQMTKADIVHARSYVAATLALPYCLATNTPLLFDTRGLWADERIEAGSWTKGGKIDRSLRFVEQTLMQKASAITVLTNAMAHHLRTNPAFAPHISCPIHVIPTCTDLKLFHPQARPDPEVFALTKGTKTLIYLGALGERNHVQETAQFYLSWRKHAPNSRFLVISKDSATPIRTILQRASAEHELIHTALPRHRVPAALQCGTAGLFLYKGSVGTLGIAPTKLGELLAMGLPVAGNLVGDVGEILSSGAGVSLLSFQASEFDRVALELYNRSQMPETAKKCNSIAHQWFSLEAGVSAYHHVYQTMLNRGHTQFASLNWPEGGLNVRDSRPLRT